MRKKILPAHFTKDLECHESEGGPIKALVLLRTLKKSPGLSNTHELSAFLAEHLKKHNVTTEILRLVDYNILPGTRNDMGKGDDWPKKILPKLLAADIIVFATPIWWGSVSSVLQ